MSSGSLGLGDQIDVFDSELSESGPNELYAVPAPCSGMSQRHPGRLRTLPLCDDPDDVGDRLRVEVLSPKRAAADHQRDFVADAPLELADESLRLGDSTPLRDIAEGEIAVVSDEDDRGDAVGFSSERERRRQDASIRGDTRSRGCYPTGAEIDCQQKGQLCHVVFPQEL